MKLKTTLIALGLLSSTSVLAAPTQWAGNGHWYELVSTPLSFGDAVTEASTRTHLGLGGHLVTLTSADENAFVHGLTGGGAAWLGASDAAVEGEWRWLSGPEAGQLLTYTNLIEKAKTILTKPNTMNCLKPLPKMSSNLLMLKTEPKVRSQVS